MQDLVRVVARVALLGVSVVIPAMAAAQAPAAPPVAPAAAQAPRPVVAPASVPAKAVDLMTPEGVAVFGAQWKTMEAKIVAGPPIANAMAGYTASYDVQPHAGDAAFDDSSWPVIDPKALADHRGGGKDCFIWYRTSLTIPAKVGDFDTTGATVVFTAYVDDYAEVWVNGQMPRRVGYLSPGTVQGFNMPNRVVISESVKPGDKFQIAVFGINGPISVAPMNFVYFREAKVEFYH
jgi:gluconolactonase